MPRPLRCDGPSALHHVTNRGHGHRLLFDGQADVAVFIGLLERAVARGQIEVHAYCLLATHFHLLVGSRAGTVAEGLGWVEDLYARYFNRTRERDGHVFKGRYFARRVEDLLYLAMVIAYIDRNAVEAGLVGHPGAYPHGSARHYLGEAGCPWLRRDVVESLACRIARIATFTPDAYVALWRAALPVGDALVAQAVRSARVPVAPIARLVRAGPLYVQRWLLERALQEEGPRGAALVLGIDQFKEVTRLLPPTVMWARPARSAEDMRKPIEVGLLRSAAGLTNGEIAARMRVSQGMVSRWLNRHREVLASDDRYGLLAAGILNRAARRAYGGLADLAVTGTDPPGRGGGPDSRDVR